ncbi:hypothetical protein BDZ89DRAFT_1172499 [Hymenopellis radicata]|nr:hypothetical protein BDZ89DRAFT_1172499 [Hymenopellis radicata]
MTCRQAMMDQALRRAWIPGTISLIFLVKSVNPFKYYNYSIHYSNTPSHFLVHIRLLLFAYSTMGTGYAYLSMSALPRNLKYSCTTASGMDPKDQSTKP